MGRRRRRRTGHPRRRMRRSRSRRTVLISQVSPTGDVDTANPTIQAYVGDRRGYYLSRDDIWVYVDSEEKRFDYRRSSGSLRCNPGRLSKGTHTVEIEVEFEDENGGLRTGNKRWTLNVKK